MKKFKSSASVILMAIISDQAGVTKTAAGVPLVVRNSGSNKANSNNVEVGMLQSGQQKVINQTPVMYGRVGQLGTEKPDKFKYTGGAGGTYFKIGDSSGSIAAGLGLTLNNPDTVPTGTSAAKASAYIASLATKGRQYKSLKLITSSDPSQFDEYAKYHWIDQYNVVREQDLSANIDAARNPMAQDQKILEFSIEFPNVTGTDSAWVFKVLEGESLTALFATLVG